MKAVSGNVNKRLILVVDDDPGISRLLRYNLEDRDTRVIAAVNGLEGMRLLTEEKIDLLILDIKLPDFSGWGILSLLRISGVYRRLPVIMISVESLETEIITTYRPDGYLQKPFDVRQLLAMVEKVASVGSKRQHIVNNTA
ncbi:MAG: response regulator [Chloroflexi bacterium]|nr:response regulator [Chloroflexota bacterium]